VNRPDHAPNPEPGAAAICVLSSSSGGNCSVVVFAAGGRRRVCLLDLGLSPRRTTRFLGEMGLELHEVSDVLLTHLDTDHAHPGWTRRPRDFHATVRLHRRQLGRAERDGFLFTRTEPFHEEDGGFQLAEGVVVRVASLSHDSLGVSAFRIEFGVGTLGYATDLGRPRPELIDMMRGVDVLAIESNYCRDMQLASARPAGLKDRIMNGSGHLSNDEAARAVEQIEPRDHAVFLHLSRECNAPELVAAMHAGADYGFTIASPTEPTRWVRIGRTGRGPTPFAAGATTLFGTEPCRGT